MTKNTKTLQSKPQPKRNLVLIAIAIISLTVPTKDPRQAILSAMQVMTLLHIPTMPRALATLRHISVTYHDHHAGDHPLRHHRHRHRQQQQQQQQHPVPLLPSALATRGNIVLRLHIIWAYQLFTTCSQRQYARPPISYFLTLNITIAVPQEKGGPNLSEPDLAASHVCERPP